MRDLLRRARVRLLAILVVGLAARVRKRHSRTPPRPGFRTLLIGAYGNGNFGDDVVGLAIAETLKDIGGSRVHIAARGDRMGWLVETVGQATAVGGGLSSISRVARLRGADVVILGGGGLLEGKPDSIHVQRLVLEYLAKLGVAGRRASRVLIHGVGISDVEYSDPVVTWAVRKMLAAVDTVTVRDPASLVVASAAGAACQLVRDPATSVLSRWAAETARDPKMLGVVIIDRDRWPDFVPGSAAAEQERDRKLRGLANRLVEISHTEMRIRLIPFHFSDTPALEDLAARYAELGGDPLMIEVTPYVGRSAPEQFRVLMSCGSVITGRFHPGLAALLGRADVEVVGNLQKLVELRGYAREDEGGSIFPPTFSDSAVALREAISR